MTLGELMSPARWLRIALMTTLSILAIYAEAAPLGLSAAAIHSPDLLLCVIAYWAIRRPGSTPVLIVFLLGLARDLLTDVPVGAGALSLVLVAEVLKHWRRAFSRTGFLLEWAAICAAAVGSSFLHWALVFLTLSQPPYLADLGQQCVFTIAVYPVIALVFRWLFRISWRRPEVPA